jgi:putative transposase
LAEYAIKTHEASVSRVCKLLNLSRSVYHYKPKLTDDNEIKQTLEELASKHRRYGFKKMFNKTRQRGYRWNHKRVYRVYCDMQLNLRRRPKKRLPARAKIELAQPEKINMSWSMDFMSDALMCGKRFRTVNLIDDCNREALGIKASISLPSKRVIEFLDSIAFSRGYPLQLRLDNGPENISKEMVSWAEKHGVNIHYIQPGKPAQNAYIERFNRTYREEVLNMYLFKNIADVQSITNEWLSEYNNERPHESLGNLTPRGYIEKQLISTNVLH